MEVNMLAVRFFTLIDTVPYPYKKRRVLICSRNGRMASEIIRSRLLRRFRKRWFETCLLYTSFSFIHRQISGGRMYSPKVKVQSNRSNRRFSCSCRSRSMMSWLCTSNAKTC